MGSYVVILGIEKDHFSRYPPYWIIFENLWGLQDSCHKKRVAYCVKRLCDATTKNKEYAKGTLQCIQALTTLLQKDDDAWRPCLKRCMNHVAQWIVFAPKKDEEFASGVFSLLPPSTGSRTKNSFSEFGLKQPQTSSNFL